MTNRKKSLEIDDIAAAWAARLDRGPLSKEEESALQEWLTRDSRHLGAYARARAVLASTDRARALGTPFGAAPVLEGVSQRVTRRRVLVIGGAAALATCVAVIASFTPRAYARSFRTGIGQRRIVSLPDGSTVTLNTSSSIDVRYTPEHRAVALLDGEALFDVAKEPGRPFLVNTSYIDVLAVGTSFAVEFLSDEPVRVLVRDGTVDVMRPGAPVAEAVRITANTRIIAPADGPIVAESVSAAEMDRELAWLAGQLAFEGETLQEAAEEFARYSRLRIIIENHSVGRKTITGLFAANDPVGFAEAVAKSLGLHVTVEGNQITLSR